MKWAQKSAISNYCYIQAGHSIQDKGLICTDFLLAISSRPYKIMSILCKISFSQKGCGRLRGIAMGGAEVAVAPRHWDISGPKFPSAT